MVYYKGIKKVNMTMYIMNAIDKPVLLPIVNARLSFNPILDSLVGSFLACIAED